MIQLPENWQDTIRVYPPNKLLLLHFKNTANQYFTYYLNHDLAFTLDDTISKLGESASAETKAYVLKLDLTTEYQDVIDQEWVPAPLPDWTMCSIAQYKAQGMHLESNNA